MRKAAKVPLIVAMNKMDKPDAIRDASRTTRAARSRAPKNSAATRSSCRVSAKTGEGVDALLDAILAAGRSAGTARPSPDGRASGVVIESALDKGRGPVATVLVQQGKLKKGDFLVCGIAVRPRARAVRRNRQAGAEAGPSIPVQVLGLSGVPDAGDDFVVVADERLAKDVAQQREHKRRESRLVKQAGNRMEDIMAQMGQGEGQQTLNLVVKADVQGSVEALRESLTGIVERRDPAST